METGRVPSHAPKITPFHMLDCLGGNVVDKLLSAGIAGEKLEERRLFLEPSHDVERRGISNREPLPPAAMLGQLQATLPSQEHEPVS